MVPRRGPGNDNDCRPATFVSPMRQRGGRWDGPLPRLHVGLTKQFLTKESLPMRTSLLALAALASVALGGGPAETPIDIGTAKRLTWDDSLLAKSQGIRFRMHQPH